MHKLNCSKIYFKRYAVALALILFFLQSKSQTLQRQSIASAGVYMLGGGTLIQQTIGQPYGTNAYYGNEITYRPGFQQPVFKVELIHSTISLNVFPNPATRLVTIQSSELLTDVLIQVFDMSGKLLIHQQISEFKTYSFNCEGWANGFYMISVSAAKKNKYASQLVILN